MKIYTIGFTKKSAEEFFKSLKDNQIVNLVDIRLNNTSQLSGFTKKNDLTFFLKELLNVNYYHFDFLAPTKEMRKIKDWNEYSEEYLKLLNEREVLKKLDIEFFNNKTVFLCSEYSAHNCHRSILTQFLKDNWDDVEIIHL